MKKNEPLVHLVKEENRQYYTLCGSPPSMLDIWDKPLKPTCKECFEVQQFQLSTDAKKISWDF